MRRNLRFCVTVLIILAATSICSVVAQQTRDAVKPKAIEQTGFEVIGIEVRTNNASEATGAGAIPKQWQRLFAEGVLNRIPDRLDQSIVAVYTNYASDANGEYSFVLGAKVKPGSKAPSGMVAVPVPAGKYLEFVTAKGPGAEVVPPAWMQIYGYFQAHPAPARAFETDYEVYSETSDPNAVQAHIFIGVK